MIAYLAFYFTYFGVVGIFMPYINLFLAERGLGSVAIGAVGAVVPLARAAVQPIAGRLADRPEWRGRILVTCGSASLLGIAALVPARSFTTIAFALVLFATLHAPLLSTAEVVTLETAERIGWQYGRVRLWGSVGFVVFSVSFGAASDAWGLRIFPFALALVCVANLGALVPLARGASSREFRTDAGDSSPTRLPAALWILLGAVFLSQVAHGPYYGFFSLDLERHGYSRQAIGLLWALGVAAEIVLMARSASLLRAAGWRRFFLTSFALAVVRWILLASSVALPVVIAAQLLHAASFAGLHMAAMAWLHSALPSGRRGFAQSLYSVSFGIGSATGVFASGFLYDRYGARPLFAAATLVALAVLPLAARLRLAPAQ